jgi:histone deacetylase 11
MDPPNEENIEKTKKNNDLKNDDRRDMSEQFYSYFGTLEPDSHPLVYSEKYNISFLGLEKLHPFDSCKYKNVVAKLAERKIIDIKRLIEPQKIPTDEHLLLVHTPEYLKSLKSSRTVAYITEIFIVALMPNSLVRWRVLKPFLYATAGSILAGKVAIERGYAINLGGGFHHCCGYQGGGFCAYADITLSLRYVRKYFGVQKVMIIDLDAHQGNGHERDKLEAQDNDLYILDIYNCEIYPHDEVAKAAINLAIELHCGEEDRTYLKYLRDALNKAFSEFTPNIIFYNAGTDILEDDPLGLLKITPQGVIERDELVFRAAIERKIPIVMLLSGGYQKSNAEVIANSIANLDKKFHIINKNVLADVANRNNTNREDT